jgi:hypothetical protein
MLELRNASKDFAERGKAMLMFSILKYRGRVIFVTNFCKRNEFSSNLIKIER